MRCAIVFLRSRLAFALESLLECFGQVMSGREELHETYVLSYKVAPGVDVRNLVVRWVRLALVWRSSVPHCQRCAEVILERCNALCHCVLRSRLAFFH